MSSPPHHSSTQPKRIAVIGGGLAGLSAAHRLLELSGERRSEIRVTLIEAGPRLGGIVGSEQIGDYLVDVGADSFLTTKPAAVGLCRRLGIENRLLRTDPKYRGALVLYDGRPVPVPEGFQLLSPTAIWPVMTTPLFSIWGKLRMLMEYLVPRRSDLIPRSGNDNGSSRSSAVQGFIDESVASFTRRRFGREALDRLIQPLVGGIYTSDPEKLSLAATMPRFLEMERDFGSLIRASLAKKSGNPAGKSSQSDQQTDPETDSSSGARYGQFAGLVGGTEDLVGALRSKVQPLCDVRLNTCVTSVESIPSTNSPLFRLHFSNGSIEEFDAVIVAASGGRTANLVREFDANLATELASIEFASSALVISGHRLADIRDPLKAFGLVIPHNERRKILAVSFSSRKFPNRAPADRVLLRTFVGGALQPELFALSDEEMIATVRSELSDILGVTGSPDFIRVYRYPNAMPQYHVGHLERVARIEKLLAQYPGLELAGISYRGVGIPDVIASGEQAAERVIQ